MYLNMALTQLGWWQLAVESLLPFSECQLCVWA